MLRSYIILTFAFLTVGCSKAEVKQPEPSKPIVVESSREKVVRVATSYIGQKESTGNNDGPFVDEVLDTVKLKGTMSPW